MQLQDVFIPYGAYWTTPFCRWQGSLSGYHAIELAGRVGKSFLARAEIPPDSFDALTFGITVTQRSSFYGAPWLAGLIGAPEITGPTISQACATSVRMLQSAALEVRASQRECILAVACDRTSNGPHIFYPNSGGPGGTGRAEDPVLDNMNRDPYAGVAMIATAENLAAEFEIGREEQETLTLLRHDQYGRSLADDRSFQKRYMQPVELLRGRRVIGTLEADEGVHPTTAEGLAGLRPAIEGGTVTFGTSTHPADANAGIVVCGRERARSMSRDANVTVRVLAFGDARVEKGMMPKATVPAAREALERAETSVGDCAAVQTHNPFAVADVYFCREMGFDPEHVNRFGSPLVYGHPQAPMGLRGLIELIETLASLGGGRGLFSGCAGGDTAMAVVLEVS
ncbi:MAG: thiolase family protein [bacterium]|nr:thiolase family protein [bacterium]